MPPRRCRVGEQPVDLVLQVGVHGLQLAQFGLQLPDLVILPEPGPHRETEQGGTDRRGDEQRDERRDDGRSPPLGDALLAGDRTREVGEARTPGVRGASPRRLATVEIRPSLMGVSSSQPGRWRPSC